MSFAIAETTGWWWKPLGRPDGVDIVHVDLKPNADREAEAITWLSDAEQSRWKRFLHPSPAGRYALCRAALRAILCHGLDCGNDELVIAQDELGKPFALLGGKSVRVSFNVSHSGEHGLIALTRQGRVGVDVEELNTPGGLELLIDSVLSPGERACVSSGNQTERTRDFLRLWTIKEALIKALGMGLSLDMSAFEVPAGMRQGAARGVFRFPESPEAVWRVADIGGRDFSAALASEVVPSGGADTETGDYYMLSSHPIGR